VYGQLDSRPGYSVDSGQQLKSAALSRWVEGIGPMKPGSLRSVDRKVPNPAERSAR
jgi:hypothetical protein